MADGEKLTQEMAAAPEGTRKAVPPGRLNDTKPGGRFQGFLEANAEFFAAGWTLAIPCVVIWWAIVTLIYAMQLPSGVRWTAFATAVVIATSAFLIGGLVGFLFGIPRTVHGATRPTRATYYQGNTNL